MMVPIEHLSPGMRVKIVDHWVSGCNQNSKGLMDKYLGQVVTVLNVHDGYVTIEEDFGESISIKRNHHWAWNSKCIDHIVEDEQADFTPASNDEIFSFIFGN